MNTAQSTSLALAALAFAACGSPSSSNQASAAASTSPPPTGPSQTEATEAPPEALPTKSGTPLAIPSDAKAAYFVLSVKKAGDGLLLIQTRREGPSGVSFSERQVDCARNTFAYTREADTEEELLSTPSVPDKMGQRVEGSISDVVSQYACDNPPSN